jgi:hypothetical protein
MREIPTAELTAEVHEPSAVGLTAMPNASSSGAKALQLYPFQYLIKFLRL